MTNGEKMKSVFGLDRNVLKTLNHSYILPIDWWNAEYKEPVIRDNRDKNELNRFENELEPTAKNDLALIRTEGLDEEIRCTMCTNSMKSDKGCDGSCVVNKDMYKAVMDAIEKRIQPTTKNNLAVDCIDRQATLDAIIKRLGIKNEKYLLEAERAIYQQILAMPSITPHLSSELDKNSKKLEKDFGESDCISRQAVLEIYDEWFATCNIADKKASPKAKIKALPSVTSIRPKGYWIDDMSLGYHVSICSNCDWRGHGDTCLIYKPKYCPNCGADMSEVEK